MDRLLMEEKLESLRRCLSRIEEKCPATVAELDRDVDLQDIITLNLTLLFLIPLCSTRRFIYG